MIAFDPELFPHTVAIFRPTNPVGATGNPRPVYPAEGVEMAACVQRQKVNRVDTSGRTYTLTIHKVWTPTDPNVTTGTKIEWIGHVLIAEGHAEPDGLKEPDATAEVLWLTSCVETRS